MRHTEFVVNAGKHFGDGGAFADHAGSALNLGRISSRNNGGRLVVDTTLETSGATTEMLCGTGKPKQKKMQITL